MMLGRNGSDTRQMPRCSGCGHRRIYHFRMVHAPVRRRAVDGVVRAVTLADEVAVSCSMPDCTCSKYAPRLEVVSA